MATVKISNFSTIWTSSAVEYNGIKLNILDNASSGSSKAIDLQVNSASIFNVNKNGTVTASSFIGSMTGSLEGTSSWASRALLSDSSSYSNSSSYALAATTASYSNNSTTASYSNNSTSASYSNNSTTASYAVNSTTASYANNSTTASYSNNSTTASFSLNSTSASYSSLSTTASYSNNSTTASYSNSSTSASHASIATTASYVLNAITASYVLNAITASYSNNSTTSSYSVNSTSASHASSSTTASYSLLSISASYAPYQVSSSYAVNSTTASYSNNSTTASYSTNSTSASYAPYQASASYATNSTSASYAPYQASASYATNSTSASYVLNAKSSSYANDVSGSYVSSSAVYVNGDITVTGILKVGVISASKLQITASNVEIGDNIITLNTYTPYQQYAGIEVFDYSTNQKVSFVYNGGTNNWQPSGSSLSGSLTGSLLGTASYASNVPNVYRQTTTNSAETTQTLNYSASINWNVDSGSFATVTLTGNGKIENPTNIRAGGTYILFVKQDTSGSRSLTWGTAFKWSNGTIPTMTPTASATDIVSFASDGTYMYGVAQPYFI